MWVKKSVEAKWPSSYRRSRPSPASSGHGLPHASANANSAIRVEAFPEADNGKSDVLSQTVSVKFSTDRPSGQRARRGLTLSRTQGFTLYLNSVHTLLGK